jgi:GNAT superfamily N-acetyltransferase
MIEVRTATPADHASILHAYGIWGYRGGLTPADSVFMAFQGDTLIGLVRMVPEASTIVLRGMHIHPDYRRQGIGTQLLQSAMMWLGKQECYCLPYPHLVEFYSQANFHECAPHEIPSFLEERMTEYLKRGTQVLVMCRPISHNDAL